MRLCRSHNQGVIKDEADSKTKKEERESRERRNKRNGNGGFDSRGSSQTAADGGEFGTGRDRDSGGGR